MLKPISFSLVILISALLLGVTTARAANSADPALTAPIADESLNGELVNSELGSDDQPPPAEYPYPGAKEEGIVAPAAAQAAAPAPPPADVERPLKIDEETGDYHYDTSTVEKGSLKPKNESAVNPESVKDNGEYTYAVDEKPAPYSDRVGPERPMKILASGEFKYATEKSPITGTAAFRVGFFGPPNLLNTDTHKYFQDIYTKDQLPVLFGEYEWPLTSRLGHLGVKFGSGLFLAQGQGQFVKTDTSRRLDDLPPEKYTFLMFPNQLTAQYRFQYSDAQPIVPYVEGGFGFFTFAELRDDSAGPRFGGAATTVLAGGVNFLMDWLDPDAIQRLDNDYGINHVYFATEFRQVIGLNKTYDFSSSVINAGFVLQF